LWLGNPQHPSVHYNPVGQYWSARGNREIRALGVRSKKAKASVAKD
jgi:hypothetical protein